MKILMVQETDWLGRYPVHQHHLAEKMSLRGHEVRVIDYEILWRTQGKRELYSRRETFTDVAKIYSSVRVTVIRPGIIKIPWLNYVSLLFTHNKEVHRQIGEFSPEVTIGFSILNSYLLEKTARENNIPFIYYWIDTLDRLIPFAPFRILAKMVERETLKRADRVLVINDTLRDYVVGMGASPERTQVLRGGIDVEQFNPPGDGQAIRKKYGFKKGDVVLFFMGFLYRFSGLKEVALELAKVENHNIKLLIVGHGDSYQELKQIRKKYDLEDRVILAGRKPYQEISAFIAAGDICLLPAYPDERIMQDIVPIKMYEYMAMKKPVVATRLPGIIKEFGEDSGVVYVERPENVVVKAIEMMQSGSVERLGAKARTFVEKYSWDNIADEFEKILEEVIKEKKRKI